MAIIVQFSPSGLDRAKYDATLRRFEEAGEGTPPGRLSHYFYESGGAPRILEVWDSQQSFERHGQIIMPILQSAGIDAGQPEINTAHNVISGQ
jgi:quinol monooxygenase YgiN